MNSTKISRMHARWIGHLYSLVLKFSLAAGKSSRAPLRPLQRPQCHIALVTFGCPAQGKAQGRAAVPQHGARQSLLALSWLHPEVPWLLGEEGPCQWPVVLASSASFTFSPPFPPCLFYKQAFQENSALRGVVPSDMLSELCCPG